MTNDEKPVEVTILDKDIYLDTHIDARESEEVYLGDGCWGKAPYFEHTQEN